MVLPTLSFEEIEFEIAHENEDRRMPMVAGIIVLLVLSFVAVIMRLIARRMQGLRLGWNDYTIVFALAVAVAMCGVTLGAISLGFGKHVVLLGEFKAFKVAKLLYVTEILFPVCNTTVKVSILLLYHSIFGGSKNRAFDISLRIIAVLWVLLTIAGTFCIALQCVPVSLAWTSDHTEHCLNLEACILALTIFSVFLNTATLVLPMPLIWQLNLSPKRKFGVSALFFLGGADVAVSILRAALTKTIDPRVVDFSWDQCVSTMIAILEPTIGIICACLPVLRPIFRHAYRSISSSVRGSSTSRTTPSNTKTGHSAWTVPIVMMMTGKSGKGKTGLDSTTKSFNLKEREAMGTPLPPYTRKAASRSSKSSRSAQKNTTVDTSTTLNSHTSGSRNISSPLQSMNRGDDDGIYPIENLRASRKSSRVDFHLPAATYDVNAAAAGYVRRPSAGNAVSRPNMTMQSPSEQQQDQWSPYQDSPTDNLPRPGVARTTSRDPTAAPMTPPSAVGSSPTLIGSPASPQRRHQLKNSTTSPIDAIANPTAASASVAAAIGLATSDGAHSATTTTSPPPAAFRGPNGGVQTWRTESPSRPVLGRLSTPPQPEANRGFSFQYSADPSADARGQASFQTTPQRLGSPIEAPEARAPTGRRTPSHMTEMRTQSPYRPPFAAALASNPPTMQAPPQGGATPPLPSLSPPPLQPRKQSSNPNFSAATSDSRPRSSSRGTPHYVKSPLTDPDAKIRIGTPKQVEIKAPTPRSQQPPLSHSRSDQQLPMRAEQQYNPASYPMQPPPAYQSPPAPAAGPSHVEETSYFNASSSSSDSSSPQDLHIEPLAPVNYPLRPHVDDQMPERTRNGSPSPARGRAGSRRRPERLNLHGTTSAATIQARAQQYAGERQHVRQQLPRLNTTGAVETDTQRRRAPRAMDYVSPGNREESISGRGSPAPQHGPGSGHHTPSSAASVNKALPSLPMGLELRGLGLKPSTPPPRDTASPRRWDMI